jgi:hypothetical protein
MLTLEAVAIITSAIQFRIRLRLPADRFSATQTGRRCHVATTVAGVNQGQNAAPEAPIVPRQCPPLTFT